MIYYGTYASCIVQSLKWRVLSCKIVKSYMSTSMVLYSNYYCTESVLYIIIMSKLEMEKILL